MAGHTGAAITTVAAIILIGVSGIGTGTDRQAPSVKLTNQENDDEGDRNIGGWSAPWVIVLAAVCRGATCAGGQLSENLRGGLFAR